MMPYAAELAPRGRRLTGRLGLSPARLGSRVRAWVPVRWTGTTGCPLDERSFTDE